MNGAALALLALVCMLAQDTPVSPLIAPTGAISGTVVDARTGGPIADAAVSLRPLGPTFTTPGEGVTDAKGRFVFRGIAAGDYVITVTRFGYADGGFGRTPHAASPRNVTLADGEWFSDAHVLLWRPAAVNGRVTDERGEPVVGVPVRLLALLSVGRRQQLAAGPGATTDDRGIYRIAGVRPGKYIVNVPSVQSALPAGVSAAPKPVQGVAATPRPALKTSDGHRLIVGYYATPPASNGRTLAYPPVFHPNARTVTDASVIDLAPGDDREGVDLRLEPVPSARISGTVDGPADAVAGLLLRLVSAGSEGLGVGSETATTIVAGNGTFAFLNVPAGAYTIDARRAVAQYELPAANGRVGSSWTATPPGYALDAVVMFSGAASAPAGTMFGMRAAQGTAAYWGRTAVAVEGRDLEDVVVTMHRGASLRGRIVWDTAKKVREEMEFASVLGEPTGGDLAIALPTGGIARRQSGGTFTIEGMMPTSYSLRVMIGGNWAVKSITWNGRDYTNVPFDASSGADFNDVVVTLTDKIASITGTARDAQGRVPNSSIVIAFPVEREQWTSDAMNPPRMRAVAVGSAGTYRLGNVPAGDYYVMAIDHAAVDADTNAWRDPTFLDSAHQLAERVTLEWGETKTLDLRVVRMR